MSISNSSSHSFFKLNPTPKSSRDDSKKLKHTQSYVSVDMMQIQIERYIQEIDEISQENANARIECLELEKDVDAIAKALDKNIDILTEANEALSNEIAELQDEINEKNRWILKIKSIYKRLLKNNVYFEKYGGLDFDFLNKICDNHHSLNISDHHIPTLRRFAKETPYFHHCNTKEEFIKRCSQLVQDIQKAREKTEQDQGYAEKIRNLKQHNDMMNAKISKEISSLSFEKDHLLKNIQNLQQQNSKLRNSYRGFESNTEIFMSTKRFLSPPNKILFENQKKEIDQFFSKR